MLRGQRRILESIIMGINVRLPINIGVGPTLYRGESEINRLKILF